MVIWKFPLALALAPMTIRVPRGGRLLTMQLQDRRPVLWFLVDDSVPDEARTFRFCMTGEADLPDQFKAAPYCGTVQAVGLVWHLFEVTDCAR